MKYIKLFEGFFRDILDHEVSNEPGVDIHSFKFRGRVASLIKKEVDSYMYDILDIYQETDIDDYRYLDYSIGDNPTSLLKLGYRNIIVNGVDMDDFLRRYEYVSMILDREFGLKAIFRGIELRNRNVYFDHMFKEGDYPVGGKFRILITLMDKDEEAHSKSTFLS
jgi:hypothetical protein